MTKPVSPEELSALLDGELSAERISEIHRALANDATLRAEYEQLAKLDRNWSAAANHARFACSISRQMHPQWNSQSWRMRLIILILLITIRLFAKWPISTTLVIAIHTLALGALLIAITRLTRQVDRV